MKKRYFFLVAALLFTHDSLYSDTERDTDVQYPFYGRRSHSYYSHGTSNAAKNEQPSAAAAAEKRWLRYYYSHDLVQARIDDYNDQLAAWAGEAHWAARKKIIREAVLKGVHPDKLVYSNCTALHEVLLHEKDEEDTISNKIFKFINNEETELNLARFLLQNKANPNQKDTNGRPIFGLVATPAMAQLLFDHGGDKAVAQHGPELLQRACAMQQRVKEPELMVEWYLHKRVDVNATYDGQTALHVAVEHGTARVVKMLAYANASLSQVAATRAWYKGHTVPQMIKRKQAVAGDTKIKAGMMRASLKQAEKLREQYAVKCLLRKKIPIELSFKIFGFNRLTYNELEAKPISISSAP